MSTPEDEFNQFREKLDEQASLEAEMDAIVERFREFVEQSGANTDDPKVQIGILVLAAEKAMVEEVILIKPEEPQILNTKKELQARFFIDHPEPFWQELIDNEFPGESLQKEDSEMIVNEFNRQLSQTESLQMIADRTESEMLDFLILQGLSVSETDDQITLIMPYLVFLKNVPQIMVQDKFERAREVLGEFGCLPNPAWEAFLEEFFPTSDTPDENT